MELIEPTFISNNIISNNIITYLYIKIICEDDGD